MKEIVDNKTDKFQNRILEYLKQLAAETDEVKQSDFFKHYLDTMSRFWNYSFRNQLLIFRQMPTATKVAGFRKWKELKRYVKKGSKAIQILAPFIRKKIEIDEKTGDEIETEMTTFYPVNVFDISQTQGEPLPEIDITVDGNNHELFLGLLTKLCDSKNIKVDFKNLGIDGLYGYSKGGQIAIENTEGVNTQVNIMIHEVAHELLSHKDQKLSRQHREIQAEGVAYVVTKHFGIANKSFSYLALYDADYKKIMENLKAISDGAKEIIEFIESDISHKFC